MARPLVALGSLALTALALACGGAGGLSPGPAAVLKGAGVALAGLRTVSLDMDFGPGLTVDEITLFQARSRVRLPGDSDAAFRLRRGGFLVDLSIVTTRGHRYLRLPPSGFRELTPDEAAEIPDPAGTFDPPGGLPGLLTAGRDLRYLGTGRVGDADADRVSATYTAALLQRLIRAQPAADGAGTIWVGRSDHLVRRVMLSGPLREAGKRFLVELDLHDFDRPLTMVTPPAA